MADTTAGKDGAMSDAENEGRERPGGKPPKKDKVSAEKLRSQSAERRQARKEARAERTEEDRRRSRRALVNTVLALGIVGCVAFSSVTGGKADDQSAANQAHVTALTDQVTELENRPVHEDPVGAMSSLADMATADAAKVAAGQQAFQGLYAAAGTDQGSGDGGPSAADQAIADHRADMTDLFDPDSFIIADDQVTIPGSMPLDDPESEIDPRYEWYVRYDGAAPSAPEASAWRVSSITPLLSETDASGATDQASVVWSCTDAESGKTLAWASATYTVSGDSGAFSELSVTVSTYGAGHQQKTGA